MNHIPGNRWRYVVVTAMQSLTDFRYNNVRELANHMQFFYSYMDVDTVANYARQLPLLGFSRCRSTIQPY